MTYNYLQSTASSRARYNATLAQHQKSTKPPVWT
ncbi:MAG: hypothetical protein JWP52_2220, partial [Rhizobacter sp.]|nr:hypothetical protein [Rhizobacter sp.]